MQHFIRLILFVFCSAQALQGISQPYFLATGTIVGNNIEFKIMPVNGAITCGWSDLEFFLRNSTGAPNASAALEDAAISVNTTDFPGVSGIAYNGTNVQGVETGYNNYWIGTSFTPTASKTYNQNQEYLLFTIAFSTSPADFNFQICHNEPDFTPHYLALTDQGGNDLTNLTGTCKYYGPGATICEPDNCPADNGGNNHILPLSGVFPVELIDFQVQKEGDHQARLSWETALEIDFDAFEIERQNGNQIWEQIGLEPAHAVDGGGASYTFYDHAAYEEFEYYRLKMRDHGGAVNYSPIRFIQFDRELALHLFPNPTADLIYLQAGAHVPESDIQVEIMDWSGRVVFAQQIELVPNAQNRLSLRANALPSGAYLFRASSADGFLYSQRIVVQGGF